MNNCLMSNINFDYCSRIVYWKTVSFINLIYSTPKIFGVEQFGPTLAYFKGLFKEIESLTIKS